MIPTAENHSYGTLSDADLVGEARQGNTEAFAALVERHYSSVYAVAFSRLMKREPAEDVAQETMVRAWLFLDRLDDPERFAAWVCRISRNLSMDWLRRKQRESRLVQMVPLANNQQDNLAAPIASAQGELMHQQQADVASRSLAKLSPAERELVLLHVVEQVPLEQIAARIGVHRSTVSRQFDRALKRLRRLAGSGDLPSALAMNRSSSSAVVRSIAIASAVAAMNAAGKSTLAAAATSMSPAATGLAPAPFLHFVQTGATLMATYKTVTISAAAVVVIAAGFFIADNRSTGSAPSPASASPSRDGSPIIPQPTFNITSYPDWISGAKAFDAVHPSNGLKSAITAFEQLKRPAAARAADGRPMESPVLSQLDNVLNNGWNPNFASVGAMLVENSAAMNAAAAAGRDPAIQHPPLAGAAAKLPEISDINLLVRLMLADAQRLKAMGDIPAAARRATDALHFSAIWRSRTMPLILSLITVGNAARCAKILEEVTSVTPANSPAALDIVSSIYAFDTATSSITEWVAGEAFFVVNSARDGHMPTAGSPDGKNQQPVAQNLADAERFWTGYLEVAQKPAWEYASASAEISKSDVFARIMKPNLDEFVGRLQVVQARLRTVAVAAALKAGRGDLVTAFPDPFTGKPLRISATAVYSFGPDGKDDQAAKPFDTKTMQGDIMARK